MNIVTVASLIVLLTVIVGAILAIAFVALSHTVTANQNVLEKEKTGYNPRATAGHKIMAQADKAVQLNQAQALAAQQAARLPRGANMNIRSKVGEEAKQLTASDGVGQDPVTAAKIASFHTWNGLQYRLSKAAPASAPSAQARPAAAAKPAGPPELRPGIDFAFIAITDSMTAEEKRKATIANSKAKSAAMKAAKASGAGAPGEEMVMEEGTPVAAATSFAAPLATGGTVEPIPGVHYEEIAITEGMSPEEIRKARIANSKAKAAAAKNMKASGMTVSAPVAEAVAPVSAPVAAAPATSSAMPKPDLIEITESMSPDEIRKARIENSKRMSAYNKALKAAGIDPTTAN